MDRPYTPPLGFNLLTPLYDAAIALFTRERTWRAAVVSRLGLQSGDIVVEIGSGTGAMARSILSTNPNLIYIGFDPDQRAVSMAEKRIKFHQFVAQFQVQFFDENAPIPNCLPLKFVCALVLHQTPLVEKRRIIENVFARLPPGGLFILADYGLQKTALMKFLFRQTVQRLDGRKNTQHNADGILPDLLEGAGFLISENVDAFSTLTGTIDVYTASKPDPGESQSDGLKLL